MHLKGWKMSTSFETYEKEMQEALGAAPAGSGTDGICKNREKIEELLSSAIQMTPLPAKLIIITAKYLFSQWCDQHCKKLA
jgi:hypothetical protein